MFKTIVILTIVFVNYCEMNADFHQLRNKQMTADRRREPLQQIKADNNENQTERYTTVSGKSKRGSLESFQNNSEVFYSYFKQGVVNFSPINNVEDSSQTDELDEESKKSKKKYDNMRRSKKHHPINNVEKEDNKKNVKKENDSSNSINSSSHRKHHKHKKHHEKKTKHLSKREKHHKKKHGKEKNKDKKEAETKDNDNNTLKGTMKISISISEENKNMSNKNKDKEKSKGKHKYTGEAIKLLDKVIDLRTKLAIEKSMVDHKDEKGSKKENSPKSKDDHEKKRDKEKSKDKKKEKSEDEQKEKSEDNKKEKSQDKKKEKSEGKKSEKSKDKKKEKSEDNKKEKSEDKKKEKSQDKKKEKIQDKKKEKSENMNHVSEKYNTNKTKQAKEKSNNKPKQINKQSKSMDVLRTPTKITAAVLKEFLTSTKDSKRAQNTTTNKKTATPKPNFKPVQNTIKKKFNGQLMLRSHRKTEEDQIRATQMAALFLSNDTKGALRDSGRGEQALSILSPYAITAQMELLMKDFPEANASVTKIGQTVEYNDIVLITIKAKEKDQAYFRTKDNKYMDDVPEKKIIFIVHGLTVMGLKHMTSLVQILELKILLSYYLKHLDKFDFYLMPLANPDGYSASLSSHSKIWNKNASPQNVCPGVFVDRNFDVKWNSSHVISSCSQLYPGAAPFSEEESKAVREIFHNYGHKILAYIHVHAGSFDETVFKGDAVLYPRGYTEAQSDDDKYIDIKGEIDEAMKNASFRVMSVTVDTLASWYGVVTGTSVDYAASVYGIPYAMEFVMQIYDTESLTNNALTEIWSRLIDTTFNNMWKSLQKGADARRYYNDLYNVL